MAWTKAVIQKPAPYWEGTAAYKGEMKEIKLDDYRKYFSSSGRGRDRIA